MTREEKRKLGKWLKWHTLEAIHPYTNRPADVVAVPELARFIRNMPTNEEPKREKYTYDDLKYAEGEPRYEVKVSDIEQLSKLLRFFRRNASRSTYINSRELMDIESLLYSGVDCLYVEQMLDYSIDRLHYVFTNSPSVFCETIDFDDVDFSSGE